jgi:hypothetical protein
MALGSFADPDSVWSLVSGPESGSLRAMSHKKDKLRDLMF